MKLGSLALILPLLFGLTAAAAPGAAEDQVFNWTGRVADHKIMVQVSIPPAHHLYQESTVVGVTDGAGREIQPETVPVAVIHEDEFSGKTAVYEGAGTHVWTFPVSGSAPYKVIITYQGCRTKSHLAPAACFPPRTRELQLGLEPALVAKPDEAPVRRPVGPEPGPVAPVNAEKLVRLLKTFTPGPSAVGNMNPREFLQFLDQTRGKDVPFAEKNFLLVSLLVLLGGLLLNLTPCVLPMIPINLAIIGAGARSATGWPGFRRGFIYGLGMAPAYGLLGLVAVLTGAKFGALNSLAWFNFGIALIFLVLALAVFDLITIDFSGFSRGKPRIGQVDKQGLLPVLVLGLVSALLAGACVAPVVIGVLVYSTALYGGGNYSGLLLPFFLGLGMALPWPFAGAGLSFLPKPGRWMLWIKRVFGLIIIALAMKYAHLGYQLWPGRAEAGPSDSLLVLRDGLLRAERERKPVFLDLWASWCGACSQMEATTLAEPQVKRRLQAYVEIKFQAEKPHSPEIKPILDQLRVSGFPTYMLLYPGSAP